ncbi:MAG: VPLPA-CTERM sorting domain-containing protein [Rhodobacteraceae bacterium]|nr:VPLPA-CTERM sorting domain-containing protein [Paracoccaceae bacterium]
MLRTKQFLAAFAVTLFSTSASFAASVPAPSVSDVQSILSDLSDRNVRVNSRFLDPGDKGHAYVFTAPVDLAILGSGKNNSRSELLAFARTGDKKNRGPANPYVDDGEAGNRIDLFIDGLGSLTDDLSALVAGLGTDWLSAATVAPGEFFAFNVKGTRRNAPIDTVVFAGDYYGALYPGSPGDNNMAPVPLPAGALLLLTGLGSIVLLRRRRRV